MDAFPTVAVESLACGTEVVCFRETGVAGAVTHNETGYIVEEKLPLALSRGIIELITRQKNKDMKLACVERARNVFSDEIVASQYLDVYRSVL